MFNRTQTLTMTSESVVFHTMPIASFAAADDDNDVDGPVG